jgi:hypothetical protein
MFEERVRKGADRLDKVKPGWANQVDVRTLDLGSFNGCVLGQLYGTQKCHEVISDNWQEARALGFYLASIEIGGRGLTIQEAYAPLTAAWVAEILRRRVPKDVQEMPFLTRMLNDTKGRILAFFGR